MVALDSSASCAAAAQLARDAYRRGVRPSQIVPDLVAFLQSHNWSVNSVLLARVACEAFQLTISECKQAEGIHWTGEVRNPDVFDRYLMPLIDRNRPAWDA